MEVSLTSYEKDNELLNEYIDSNSDMVNRAKVTECCKIKRV